MRWKETIITPSDIIVFEKGTIKGLNGTVTYQNLWHTVKAVLKGKFIGLSDYIENEERFQISNLTFYHRKLEKED